VRNKHTFIILIICLLILSSCNFNNSIQIVDEAIEKKGADNVQNSDSEGVLLNNLTAEFQSGLDKLHQASVYTIDMEIFLDEDDIRVEGSEEVVYTNQESVPLETIYFRLIPNVGGDYLTVFEVVPWHILL